MGGCSIKYQLFQHELAQRTKAAGLQGQIEASARVLPLSDWETGPLSLPWNPETGIPMPVAALGLASPISLSRTGDQA